MTPVRAVSFVILLRMKITKLGHCCLLIEENGVRILTDPGMFTVPAHEVVSDLNVVLITHEHADHFHIPSLKAILERNPLAKVVCGPDVGEQLLVEGIAHMVVGDGGRAEEKGVTIEGYGANHAIVHQSIPQARNTGYFVGGKLFYPGDAFTDPNRSVDILALPTGGPWMKLAEAIDYALALKPRTAFAVHDFVASEAGQSITQRIAGSILEAQGIELRPVELNKEYEF